MAEARPGVRGVGFTVGFGADSLHELGPALDEMETLGVDSVELFLAAFGVVVGGRTRANALREMRRLCADRPFGVTLHGPLSADLGRADTAAVDRGVLRACLDVCGEIGAPVYVQHATLPRAEEACAAFGRETETLAAEAAHAEAAGVTIAVETMFSAEGRRAATPAELARSLAEIDSPAVGATIDFAHSALNCAVLGRDLFDELAALAPHARHLHIHDNFFRLSPIRTWSPADAITFGYGDVHLPPGAGALDWERLASLPYAGPACANLEISERWRWEWPDAIRWTRNWVSSAKAARRAA